MWAQFNPTMMGLGLMLLIFGMFASWAMYSRLSNADFRWEAWAGNKLYQCLRGTAGGAVIGCLGYLALESTLQPIGIDALDCVLFAAPFTSCVMVFFSSELCTSLDLQPQPYQYV